MRTLNVLERADTEIRPLPLKQFEHLITQDQYRRFMDALERAHRVLQGRTIWNINSTAHGGGVAEMLQSMIGYVRGAGLDTCWVVIQSGPDFFQVTKRIHNHLHGSAGDGGQLDDEAKRIYESSLQPSAEALASQVRRGDVVLLHDPQTAGLTQAMRDIGAHTIWRCHVGLDMPNNTARKAWNFLLPYVTPADAYVFSRSDFAWEGLDRSKIFVIPPSIDALSPKNRDLDPQQVDAILAITGITADGPDRASRFLRQDGREAVVTRPAVMYEDSKLPLGHPFVTQVSRWDRLKDPLGVMKGFVDHVAPNHEAHLVLVGPAVEAVADDPEGGQVLRETMRAWEQLPRAARAVVHLATLPMVDIEENATMVNAIQRKCSVAVQKSLAEGFGLTVAEAMWKGRPVVASRIGGIQDQIEHARTGYLIDDPQNLVEYGSLVLNLLADPARAAAMGNAARERVRDYFLVPRHLMQYADLIEKLVTGVPLASEFA